MSDGPTNPPFLVIEKYHLSRDKARAALIAALARYGVEEPHGGWHSLTLNWTHAHEAPSSSFLDLLAETRRTGVVKQLQRYWDKQDPVFGGTHDEISTPNFQMKITSEYAGWRNEVQGPCRTSTIETDLMHDILDYRRQACEHSSEYDFRLTTRYFRAYLSACVSLVDAFINRHILVAKHEGFASQEFERLEAARKLEERIDLWWQVCCGGDPSALFGSMDWCQFQEIRKKRNHLMHALDPIACYSIRDVQLYLNKVRSGVGELLLRLRKAHQKPTLLFIERLRTAPRVRFRKIRFRADGQHDVKESQG